MSASEVDTSRDAVEIAADNPGVLTDAERSALLRALRDALDEADETEAALRRGMGDYIMLLAAARTARDAALARAEAAERERDALRVFAEWAAAEALRCRRVQGGSDVKHDDPGASYGYGAIIVRARAALKGLAP